MLITEEFVFIHVPKTGGTFIRVTLKDLLSNGKLDQYVHSARKRLGIELPFYNYKYEEFRQHALAKYVPVEHQDKPYMACVRSPYDRNVSEYRFEYWKEKPESWFYKLDLVKDEYPHFPNLNFEEFIHCAYELSTWPHQQVYGHGHDGARGLGWQTIQFNHMFTPEGAMLYRGIENGKDGTAVLKDALYDTHFLRMESLNQDLHSFLKNVGYPEEEIEFILPKEKFFSHRPEKDPWEDYYTPQLKKFVREREYILFELFPEYGD